MKTTLTAEQSAELIKHGVDKDKASLMQDDDRGRWPYPSVPIFTLADLLALLPKNIDTIYSLEICADNSGWDIVYGTYNEGYEPKHIAADKELVNALYSALCWAIDHNHVKLD